MSSSAPSAALLIGVGDYSIYDQSVGNPRGTSDLKGPPHDVRAWAGITSALGLAHISACASPAVEASKLQFGPTPPAVTCSGATRAEILAAIERFASHIESAGGGRGLLVWSGHGALLPEGPALCPADTTGADLQNAISFTELAALLESVAPRTNLTVIIDACHAAPILRGTSGLLALGRRGLGSASTGKLAKSAFRLRPYDILLSACGPLQTAQEYHFMGRWHGAFSWATIVTLERWGIYDDDGVRYFGIAYDKLITEVNELLAQTGFVQKAELRAPPTAHSLAAFHPRTAERPALPAGPVEGDSSEIDPGQSSGVQDVVYEIRDGNGANIIGTVLVVGSSSISLNGYTWSANREYWFWNNSPYPTTNFLLRIAPNQSPSGIVPADAWIFPNGSFPSESQNWQVNLTNGAWFLIEQGEPGAFVRKGWMKNKGDSVHWYEYGNSNHVAAPYFKLTTSAPYLRFTYFPNGPDGNPQDVLVNVSYLANSLLQDPS